MSSIVLSPGATGAAAFTIEAPSTATSRVITLPDATDTLVGKATTDTLTNKSIVATQLTGTVAAARLPAGSVIQVPTAAYKQDVFTTTSTSFVDVTNLSVTITPSNSANKILVLGAVILSNATDMGVLQLVRDSTPIQIGTAAGLRYAATADFRSFADTAVSGSITIAYLDSPATTSATTYKIQVCSRDSGTTRVNASADDANQTNRGRFASTLIVMEVVA